MLLHSETLFQKEKKKAKRITLNAFSLHLWKPHPFQARRHPKLLSPRQQRASWELVCAGDTCRAGSAQTHCPARLCAHHLSAFTLRSKDTGTQAFPVSSLEKQSSRWPYTSRLSVLLLPDQTSTSCSGSLGSYAPPPDPKHIASRAGPPGSCLPRPRAGSANYSSR